MKTTKDIKDVKVKAVSDLASKMSEARSLVFVDFTGMTMKGQQGLKSVLREADADMVVAKNTFLRIAGKAANLSDEVLSDQTLSGQTALIWGTEDAVAPLQVLGKYISENELPKWKAGVVEGAFYDAVGLAKISKLPAKEVLYAQTVGAVMAPLYGVVGTLQGNLQKLVWMLQQKAAQG